MKNIAGARVILTYTAIRVKQKGVVMAQEIDNQLSIQSLSEAAMLLAEARKDVIKKYQAYQQARELQNGLRFQLQSDLERYGEQQTKKETT